MIRVGTELTLTAWRTPGMAIDNRMCCAGTYVLTFDVLITHKSRLDFLESPSYCKMSTKGLPADSKPAFNLGVFV